MSGISKADLMEGSNTTNNLARRSPATRHRSVNRPVLTIEIGRLAREEKGVLNRLGQQARRVQAADRNVAVRPARVWVGLPVVCIPGDEQVGQPFALESEQSAERVERTPDDELLAAQRQPFRRGPAGPGCENWRAHGERRPPRRKVFVARMQEAEWRQALA